MDSALGTGDSWSDSQFGQKICFPQHCHRFQMAMVNEEGPVIELPSIWGTRVQVERLLMDHPENR